MIDFIIVAIIIVLLSFSVRYMFKMKKNGQKCVGCSGCCQSCKTCKHQ